MRNCPRRYGASGVPATSGVKGTEACAVAITCAGMTPPNEVASGDFATGEDAFGDNSMRRTGGAEGRGDAWGATAPAGS